MLVTLIVGNILGLLVGLYLIITTCCVPIISLYLDQVDDPELRSILYTTHLLSLISLLIGGIYSSPDVGIWTHILFTIYSSYNSKLIWECKYKYICAYAKFQTFIFPCVMYLIVTCILYLITSQSREHDDAINSATEKLKYVRLGDMTKFECSICLGDEQETIVKLEKCNHLFHHKCISKWFRTKLDCPNCRKAIV
jgi:hypothetical protein